MTARREIRRLAIVDRGEAAMRCVRAVRSLRAREESDIRALAFFTPSDASAPFVRHADEAFSLSSDDREVAAFLDRDRLFRALEAARADAVWPGWGFVAEDPEFVEGLDARGLIFLGPSADAMRALGDKISAKRLAESLGVPVIPWSGGALPDESAAVEIAERIGYPVVIKATSGGGGRGIRIVSEPAEFAAELRSAVSEARAAFGSSQVFVESKVEGGRHIEVQIAADEHGTVIALGCRDCSVQRRHQKVLEEAPVPLLSAATRDALEEAARRIAGAVGYVGVGTVEFLVADDSFYFLEVNPRLQVEHGVTEEIIGLDLVQLQIRIARGEEISDLVTAERGWAIEARICAEDPDADFLPAPGQIVRFDSNLGPGIRVDAGVVAGSTVSPAFDSLIAKVIATGHTREDARARLHSALAEFDLVVAGGATNKSYLLGVIDAADYRRGGVDTGWLERWDATPDRQDRCDAEALVAAAIIEHRRRDVVARARRIEAADSRASETDALLDLSHRGQIYRVRTAEIGPARYRIGLEESSCLAEWSEDSAQVAMLHLAGASLRVAYDVSEAFLRVEIGGCAYRFATHYRGEVRAGTPAVVAAVFVAPGDVVEGGETMGLLEAMKMEIGFLAPQAGTVSNVSVRVGQQVAAGDVMIVIVPSGQEDSGAASRSRIELPSTPDPLSRWLRAETGLRDHDSKAHRPAMPEVLDAMRSEIHHLVMGFKLVPERAQALVEYLENVDATLLEDGDIAGLAELRRDVRVFDDLEQLFQRAPRSSADGGVLPSNRECLRAYLLQIHGGDASLDDEFKGRVRRAMTHYGVSDLSFDAAVGDAVSRVLATRDQGELRPRLMLALLRLLVELSESRYPLGEDAELERALTSISRMRDSLPDTLVDGATAARYAIFERPKIDALATRATKRVERWLSTVEQTPSVPPDPVLAELVDAPEGVFERISAWLEDTDQRLQAIAQSAFLLRLYAPLRRVFHSWLLEGEGWIERIDLADGRTVLGATCTPQDLIQTTRRLIDVAVKIRNTEGVLIVSAAELLVTGLGDSDEAAIVSWVGASLRWHWSYDRHGPLRFTVTLLQEGAPPSHHTLVVQDEEVRARQDLLGLHPETAGRIELGRLEHFDLELVARRDDAYCFRGRARVVSGDERLFVLADVRSPFAEDDPGAGALSSIEHAFLDATELLRAALRSTEPGRHLHWNRIHLVVAGSLMAPESAIAATLCAHSTTTSRLGLESVRVRLPIRDAIGDAPGRVRELSMVDGADGQTTTRWFTASGTPVEPASDYSRKVSEARRRRLVYPYEVVRMLTRQDGPKSEIQTHAESDARFEEYDIKDTPQGPRGVAVAGRPYGANSSAIVFGIISTPTAKHPEGMKRVLILSDPTIEMGALAAPECDRIIAAIDLAECLSLPVEWVPVSSGARISMDSGTENLDATARVARRIITFTQTGGVIHIIVHGVNVGAQSYFDALATMLSHTRGCLIMTPCGSMVLTGRAALEASGSVAAEDEIGIGGFERVMGPNGEAQYFAPDLGAAYRVLYEHYRYTYVAPGERGPRVQPSTDPHDRDVRCYPYPEAARHGFATVGEIFDPEQNAGRKRPFSMRAVMRAVIDQDSDFLERWTSMRDADTTIVWDTHIGGHPLCLVGIESQAISRHHGRPPDGPASWMGGTLFPLSSKKLARAINAVSGNRPVVVLANLSGFDGSPESMRRLQLEYGAEIARAVANFEGAILFVVVSRYHGGAYVVFSRYLNDGLCAYALEGSYASVIGGEPAAVVVFGKEVHARAWSDRRIRRLWEALEREPSLEARRQFEETLEQVRLEKRSELAAEFDEVHCVERAREVQSLDDILPVSELRSYVIEKLARATAS